MISPRFQRLSLLGLGNSPPTPPEGIAGEILIVKDFDELKQQGDKVSVKFLLK